MKRAAHEEVNQNNKLNGGRLSVRVISRKGQSDHIAKVSMTAGDFMSRSVLHSRLGLAKLLVTRQVQP